MAKGNDGKSLLGKVVVSTNVVMETSQFEDRDESRMKQIQLINEPAQKFGGKP